MACEMVKENVQTLELNIPQQMMTTLLTLDNSSPTRSLDICLYNELTAFTEPILYLEKEIQYHCPCPIIKLFYVSYIY